MKNKSKQSIVIVIPTLGRIDKQITYDNIPDDRKYLVDLVVQPHEFDDMIDKYPNANVVCLPDSVNSITTTREWIWNNYDGRIWVIDDDIIFRKRNYEYGRSPLWEYTQIATNELFDEMLNDFNEQMDAGYYHGGCLPSWTIPNPAIYPHSYNKRLETNMFYDLDKLPNDIDWTSVEFGEDIHVTLQLLTRGYENVSFMKYSAQCGVTNAAGGCSLQRTLEKHNQSQLKLQQLWPDFISISETEVNSNGWTGKKYKLRVAMAKAAKYGQNVKNNKTITF